MAATEEVRDAAEQVEDSAGFERFARLGLAARTLVWSTIAVLTLLLALGRASQPDQSGALQALSRTPFGAVLLVLVAVGFVAVALYRLLTAAVGHRDQPPGRQRWGLRVKSGFEALLYVLAAVSAVRFVLGSGQDSEKQTRSTTAQVMDLPGGREVIGLVGVVVVVVALLMAWRAARADHADDIRRSAMPDALKRPAIVIGAVGLAGRNLVIALVGGFLVDAAARYEPGSAKGLDSTLLTLADRPFGSALLLVAAAALLAYGVWSVVETVWRDV
jgi:fumarate reductase subunit D